MVLLVNDVFSNGYIPFSNNTQEMIDCAGCAEAEQDAESHNNNRPEIL